MTVEAPAGIKAGADLSAGQFMAVRLTSARTVGAITDANAQVPYGILQNKPKSGEAAEVAVAGGGATNVKARAGGTIAAGDFLACNNTGELIAQPQAEASPDLYIIAVALEAAADNDIFHVDMLTPMKVAAE